MLNMIFNQYSFNVRYVETDKMGIVHHSNYYIWFELSRDEFIKSINLNYKELEDMGIMMPLVESSCKYILPAYYGDTIRITTYIKELTAAKLLFYYEVRRNDDDRIIAEGSTTQVFVNNNFKIINLKKNFPKLLEKLGGKWVAK